MQKVVANKMYTHRGVWLIRYDDEVNKGIVTDIDSSLFKTFADARRYVDKNLDSTHDKEPKVIGHWKEYK